MGAQIIPSTSSGMWQPNSTIEAFQIDENVSGNVYIPKQIAPYFVGIGKIALELDVRTRQLFGNIA